MKINIVLGVFALLSLPAFGQHQSFLFNKNEVENNLRYIASDELGGRRTGSVGEQMAADFIFKQLESYGVKPVPGKSDFFQNVPFAIINPPKSAAVSVGKTEFSLGNNLLILNGRSIETGTEIIFVGNGWVDEANGIDDYKGLDVMGKIVLSITGTPKGNDPTEVFKSMKIKQALAKERGAVALVEIYKMGIPWQFATSYFGKERMEIASGNQEEDIVYAWLKDSSPGIVQLIKEQSHTSAKISIEMGDVAKLNAKNVVGVIEGTDPELKNEYVLLSAHYDHVGVGKQGGAAFTPADSIFNGARDNGIGTIALLAAAKELAANPPKRSVVILACTAEEMGMLGSQWYVDHPLVPLASTVFNLNTDGAGYNSTGHFNVIGMGYTNVDEEMRLAGLQVGLTMLDDPAPQQNLYERSDNISFAQLGIPAVDFAPGITEMNEDVFKYYHQAIDNAETLDFDYILKFCQAYTLAARMIADKDGKIDWEEKGKAYAK